MEPQTFLRITNWDRFQHYSSDRFPVPPWIKFYVSTLDDGDLVGLPPATRLLANLLLLVAARLENRIPDSAKIVAGYVQLPTKTVTTSLKHLEKIGFIERRSLTDSEWEMARNGQLRLEPSRQTLDPGLDLTRARVLAETETGQELGSKSQRQSSTRPRAQSLPTDDQNLIDRLVELTGATAGSAAVVRANCRARPAADVARTIEAITTTTTTITNRPAYAVATLKAIAKERADLDEPDL